MKKALIIGGAGFVGHYLARHLHNDKGWEVGVTKLPAEKPDLPFADILDLDILDPAATSELLCSFMPNYIFHLAAQSSAALSWKMPAMTVDINIKGTVNVLEAVRLLEYKPRMLIIGSSEEYGKVTEAECPISEHNEIRPGNIYAVTKICQEMIGKLYFEAYCMEVIATRSFNHFGPGQSPVFVVADFCKQAAEIESGKRQPILKVGNLAAKRDFTDVRDVVRAYALLNERGTAGEVFNVGTGRSIAIQEIVDIIIKQSRTEITVEKDPEKFRPLDVTLNIADISKLNEATGWLPEIPLEITIADTLDYWRKSI